MSIMVDVTEAEAHLAELLAKVEAGEEVIISRSNTPIAHLSPIRRDNDIDALIAEIKPTGHIGSGPNLAGIRTARCYAWLFASGGRRRSQVATLRVERLIERPAPPQDNQCHGRCIRSLAGRFSLSRKA
jgi:prevent-host-death family protein